jgi:peptide deformylase
MPAVLRRGEIAGIIRGFRRTGLIPLNVIHYPHPTLRYPSKPIRRVDRDLMDTIRGMFDLMYEHQGVGLAANQIDLPLQLFVINPAGRRGEGEELVFINPVVTSPKGRDEAEEGCLSLPEITAPVVRPSSVRVSAFDASGREIDLLAEDFLARIVQHEYDHLQGVLFIDRLAPSTRQQLEPELEEFELEYRAHQQSGKVPPETDILARLQAIEKNYC